MSVARPAARSLLSRRCLASTPARPCSGAVAVTAAAFPAPSARICTSPPAAPTIAPTAPQHHRQFHASGTLAARKRPRFRNIAASEMGLTSAEQVEELTQERFPEYTEEEKKALAEIYNSEQLGALEAAEKVIDPKDFTVQGRFRNDPYQLGYVDDMSVMRPIIDGRPKTKGAPDLKARFMSPDEFTEDFIKWLRSFVPKDVNLEGLSEAELDAVLDKYAPTNLDVLRYMTERSSLTDGGKGSNSALAPALMNKVPGVAGLYKRQQDPDDEGLDPTGIYQHTKRQTGLRVRDMKNLTHKVIVRRWVSNQTRLGKIQSTYYLSIVGNRDGRLGLGEGKSTDAEAALQKSMLAAIKNMVPIRMYENRTIYGKVEGKVSATVVQLAARPPGFGLRVSHRIFEMCRAAGIRDLSARIPRSRCPMNTVKAAFKALTNQPNPENIAIGRGKKLVDVRKVYYGGAVY